MSINTGTGMKSSYRVKLLRGGGEAEDWLEHILPSCLTIESTSIMVRDANNAALLADFPHSSTVELTLIHERVLRVSSRQRNIRFALKLQDVNEMKRLVAELKSKGYPECKTKHEVEMAGGGGGGGGGRAGGGGGGGGGGSESSSSSSSTKKRKRAAPVIPDLSDPSTIELVLALLYDERFPSFVSQIESIISSFKDKIKATTP